MVSYAGQSYNERNLGGAMHNLRIILRITWPTMLFGIGILSTRAVCYYFEVPQPTVIGLALLIALVTLHQFLRILRLGKEGLS